MALKRRWLPDPRFFTTNGANATRTNTAKTSAQTQFVHTLFDYPVTVYEPSFCSSFTLRPLAQVYYTNKHQSLHSHEVTDTSHGPSSPTFHQLPQARCNNYFSSNYENFYVSLNSHQQNDNHDTDHIPEGTCHIVSLTPKKQIFFGCTFLTLAVCQRLQTNTPPPLL